MFAQAKASQLEAPYFSKIVALMLLLFLIIQGGYIAYATLSMDDFWLAYHTYQYQKGLPYRDFFPYKSVLGYYVFLMPFYLFHGVLTPLWAAKGWITLINVSFLFIISRWMNKFFSARAVLLSLMLIITSPSFLLFSSEIRVDLLSYWFCLMSVLLVFEKKHGLAGIVIALGFLISQKAVWYVIASNCGFIGYFLFIDRTWSMVRNMVRFNLGALLILLMYVLFWAHYSSYAIVLRSLFYEPYFIQAIDYYQGSLFGLWISIVIDNLELIVLCLWALIGLVCRCKQKHVFVLFYVMVILFFMISARQPFLYFALVAVPAFFVLFSVFFSVIEPSLSLRQFMGLVALLSLYPITCFVIWLPRMDGGYQKSMIPLVAKLLDHGGSYFAGVPLLLEPEQGVPGLKHLVSPAISYMYSPSEKLVSILKLPSLYFTPASVPELVESIKAAPVKLYVDNNRFHWVPKALRHFLDTEYQHFWGSIFLYAPTIEAGHRLVHVKFSADYKVLAPAEVTFDHEKTQPNTILHLQEGDYLSESSHAYRLKLVPAEVLTKDLDPRYRENQWKKLLF